MGREVEIPGQLLGEGAATPNALSVGSEIIERSLKGGPIPRVPGGRGNGPRIPEFFGEGDPVHPGVLSKTVVLGESDRSKENRRKCLERNPFPPNLQLLSPLGGFRDSMTHVGAGGRFFPPEQKGPGVEGPGHQDRAQSPEREEQEEADKTSHGRCTPDGSLRPEREGRERVGGGSYCGETGAIRSCIPLLLIPPASVSWMTSWKNVSLR